MEFGVIEREFHVEASPEVVFEVLSSPTHIREWWQVSDADVRPVAGTTGELVWGDRSSGEAHVSRLTVVEADAPRSFAFRWVYDDGVQPAADNSLLVSFQLTADGQGTTVRLRETGFRERGWEAAVLEKHYADHSRGWDLHFTGGLQNYLTKLAAAA